ncbi:MAG: isoprenylcysteine carboxylmethyltransferase family protein [Gammaproteobacteria bacterium]|nr:MAG: isoprenylcysteine carboxylmethyltransferase family protein [Gammaproteobacteria bacterium]
MKNFLAHYPISSHLLVIIQMTGIAFCCYPVGLLNAGKIYWLIFCVFGAILGIHTLCYNKIGNFSVYPEIKHQATLITTGPYRYIRHPMYTSLIAMMLGITLYNFHWVNAVGLVMVMSSVIKKANKEEKLLLMRFVEYLNYQRKSYRFLPYIY